MLPGKENLTGGTKKTSKRLNPTVVKHDLVFFPSPTHLDCQHDRPTERVMSEGDGYTHQTALGDARPLSEPTGHDERGAPKPCRPSYTMETKRCTHAPTYLRPLLTRPLLVPEASRVHP